MFRVIISCAVLSSWIVVLCAGCQKDATPPATATTNQDSHYDAYCMDSAPPCEVSLAALTANGRLMDGKKISTFGVFSLRESGHLFFNFESYSAGFLGNGISLDIQADRLEDFRRWEGTYLIVRGSFEYGIGNNGAGELKDLEPPVPWPVPKGYYQHYLLLPTQDAERKD